MMFRNGYSLLVTVLRMLYTAFTMQTMWGWFLVPLGLPRLSLAHAYGIDLLVSWVVSVDMDTMIMSHNHPRVLEFYRDYPRFMRLAIVVTFNTAVLTFGFLCHWLMLKGY